MPDGEKQATPDGAGARGGKRELRDYQDRTTPAGTPASSELLNAALAYARRGWPVFPCRARAKEPLARRGFKDATTDENTVRQWWTRWPDANIGIPTGSSTFVVLDVDVRAGGDETLRELERQHGELPATVHVLTGGGGDHYWFQPPAMSLRCCRLADGLELKAEGGYVIVPPSVHPSGWPYTFEVQGHPDGMPLADMPAWLLELAQPRVEPQSDGHERPVVDLLVELPKAAAALRKLKPERCKDYQQWLEVGMALAELGEAGLALWDEWSKQCEEKYQPGVCAEKWRTFEPGQGLTLASLYYWAAQDGREREQESGSDKPVIQTTGRAIHELATAGEDALIRSGAPIYVRGDLLQRPVVDEVDASDGRKTHVVRLGTVTPELLIDYLSRAAYWLRYDRRSKRWVRDDPTLLVAKIILNRVGEWQLPRITGVVTTPTLRPDGSLLVEPGYDPATQLLLASPPEMPPIPELPTRADAEKALALLDDLLAEFPFTDEVSRAVALSALITPVVRPALGQAPMHAFTSPEAGTGKSYLVDLASAITTGRWCPVIAAGDCDRAELEKRLAAAAITATPLLSLDNVNGVLASDLLCQLIERPLVEVRLLGQSRNVTVQTRMTIFATGNNLAVSGDLVRRAIQCRLDARTEQPEQRQFARDPYSMIVADRGRYIAAALTITRAYIVAGMPNRCHPLPSFARWSDYVRSALVWLGYADPVASIEAVRREDPQRAELAAVVEAWAAVCPKEPLTAAQLAEKAASYPALRDALVAVAGKRGEIDTRALGYWLRAQRDRVVGAWRIEVITRGKGHRAWLLAPAR